MMGFIKDFHKEFLPFLQVDKRVAFMSPMFLEIIKAVGWDPMSLVLLEARVFFNLQLDLGLKKN